MRTSIFARAALALAAIASLAAAAAPDISNSPDLKPLALRVYGIRSATPLDATTVRIVIGASSTDVRKNAEAYRVVSGKDQNYAYEKFVRPASVREVAFGVEFPRPAGYAAPRQADVELNRAVIDLTLPSPMKEGCQYAVVGQGAGSSRTSSGLMVTAARTAAVFTYSASKLGEHGKVPGPDELAAMMVGLRRAASAGDGVLLLEFGAGYSVPGGNDTANYKITVNGMLAAIDRFGRRSKIDVYWPCGWPYRGIMQHDVYIGIDRELKNGDKVRVELADAVTAGATSAAFTFHSSKSISRSIKCNQLGYMTGDVKFGYLGCWFGSMPDQAASVRGSPRDKGGEYASLAPYALRFSGAPEFRVVDDESGMVVLSKRSRLVQNGLKEDFKVNHAAENVYELDFSEVKRPGNYRIEVDGVGRSISFAVGDEVYRKAFDVQSYGVFAQRCGIELKPPYSAWRRVSCHDQGIVETTVNRWSAREHDFSPLEQTVVRKGGVASIIMASGGHHDAGDYNPRSHYEVAQTLMNAYELAPRKFYDGQLNIPEKGNGVPDIIDEALWAVRLWRGLQDADGGVHCGTESQGDPDFVMTVELDDRGDYAYAKDCKASFVAAGMFAQSSRLLAKFGKKAEAADYLARARKAYAWAMRNNSPPIENRGVLSDYTVSSRAYAAAELYHTTGEESFHADFKSLVPWTANPNAEFIVWQQYDMSMPGYAYLLIPEDKADPALRKSIIDSIRKEVAMYINASSKMAYKFIRHAYAPISWGTGAYENYLVPVYTLWAITGEQQYRDWMVRTCDNTLGANPLGLSWVVGLGERTIHAPLHNSRYNPTGMPVKGMQAEGPLSRGDGYSYRDTVYPAHNDRFAVMHTFIDSSFAIAMDEGTVVTQAKSMAAFGLMMPDAPGAGR